MRKKLLCVAITLSALLAYSSAYAFFLPPYFDITINKITVGGNGNFNFHIQAHLASSGERYINDQFSIQTENGSGSNSYFSITGNGDYYEITEDVLTGWKNTGVVCRSDNPNITTSLINRGIAIIARPYSSIVCTFTNVKESEKTPVLIVPGIMGTEIKKENELLWPNLSRMMFDIGDDFLDLLQFKKDLSATDANLSVGKVVRLATTTPATLINFNYSEGLINEFKSQGYAEGNTATSTLFTFPYDWRYGVTGIYPDGKTNVDKLKQKIAEIRTQTGSNKVDIIAHSTGGLLVKKYVMDNPKSHRIDKAVFVGVPNLGAPKAVKVLLTGDNFNIQFLDDKEMKKISANLPVAYELAPSEKYVSDNGGFIKIITYNFPQNLEQDLTFNQTKDYLLSNHNLNSQAFNSAQLLHSQTFDNFDLRTAGVDLYSIIGCKSGTIGDIREFRRVDNNVVLYEAKDITGDGTVPMNSAKSLPASADHSFYAIKPDHGKMPSADGIRQKIVNIIASTSLALGDNIITQSDLTADPSKCELTGHWFQIFSPVSIEITDANGHRAGIANDGSIANDIPGADYQIMGEHKFIFLPTDDNQTYTINLIGTGNGSFTLKDQTIENGTAGATQAFVNIPVTTSGSGQVHLEGAPQGGAPSTLSFDSNGDGNTQTILPIILNANQSQDLIAPISTSTISGSKNNTGSYKSVVSITLSSTDPIIRGQESQTSGVLQTKYSLDNTGYQTFNTTTPISVSAVGAHSLKFFSTDRTGNNELEQTISFTIAVTIQSIIADVEKAFSLGWITKKEVKNELISKLNQLLQAQNMLAIPGASFSGRPKVLPGAISYEAQFFKNLGQAFIRNLDSRRKAGYINEQAYNLLADDISRLVNN